MRKKSITLYTFYELSEDKKEKVREQFRDVNVEDPDMWAEPVLEEARAHLEAQGFQGPEIYFDVSPVQGRGIYFNAALDMPELIKSYNLDPGKMEPEEIVGTVKGSDRPGVTFDSLDLEFEGDREDEETDKLEEMEDQLKEICKEEARKIFRELEEAEDHAISDEAVEDFIVNNEIEFDKNGHVFKH